MIRLQQILLFFSLLLSVSLQAQLTEKKEFTRQDTLRGTITPERAWWDVIEYKLFVQPNFDKKKIAGHITIIYKVNQHNISRMQIDLQQPMQIDKVTSGDGQSTKGIKNPKVGSTRILSYKRDGNVYFIENAPNKNKIDSIRIEFSGSPLIAVNPPWDGGWIFTKDAKGRPWITVACQGLGASVWYPCKDHQSDEPDNGATIQIKIPNDLVAVANGNLIGKQKKTDGTTWTWRVKNPINNYNIVPYIGKYVNFSDSFTGEEGKKLSLSYWVLDYNLSKAKKQFGRDVKPMLKCFEHWFGPYPFYNDGFKLVESPHLGMEHQSAIAYGNHYSDGYLGMDLSGTGWGDKWDYIIVHESGHEWFANSISTKDIADMWVHEGFTDYSEVLFVECQYGKTAANEYCRGLRKNIDNDIPIIGPYGVNQEGSGDMYAKGANMLHTIRQVINDDELFRKILRGLNKEFYHSTVTSKEVEAYMSKQAGKDLSKIFDQYLRSIKIPVLEYKITGNKIFCRWTNCVEGFNMPLQLGKAKTFLIYPTTQWQEIEIPHNYSMDDFNPNFYITVKKIE